MCRLFYSWWNQQLLPIFDSSPHLSRFTSKFFEGTDCVFTVISLANGKTSILKWNPQENLLDKFPNLIVYIVVFPLISHLSCFFFLSYICAALQVNKSICVYFLCMSLYMCTCLRGSWIRTLMFMLASVGSFWIICIFFIWLFDC